jgi:hypothetical protein
MVSTSSAGELGLHVLNRQRRRARWRGVVREVRLQSLVDVCNASVNRGGAVAFLGRPRRRGAAQLIALLSLRNQILAVSDQGCGPRIVLGAAPLPLSLQTQRSLFVRLSPIPGSRANLWRIEGDGVRNAFWITAS